MLVLASCDEPLPVLSLLYDQDLYDRINRLGGIPVMRKVHRRW